MKKRGFTLIELLAVIVVLAIIALIATPIVVSTIEKSKKGVAIESANNIIHSAELYFVSARPRYGKIDVLDEKLNYNGKKPELGEIEIDNKGNSRIYAYINGYCVTKEYEGETYASKTTKEECDWYATDNYETSEGTTFILNNQSIKDYKIYGNSIQETRSGKNLLNMEGFTTSFTNSYYAAKKTDFKLIPGKTYTLSFDYNVISATATLSTGVGYGTSQYTKDILYAQKYPNQTTGRQTVTFTVPEDIGDDNYLCVRFARTDLVDSVSVEISKIQLEEGTEATEYEEYGEMPSPEYPSEIESTGDLITNDNCSTYGSDACDNIGKYVIQVKASGKNLFDIFSKTESLDKLNYANTSVRNFELDKFYVGLSANNYLSNSNASYRIENDSIFVTSSQTGYGIGVPVKVKPNTTYVISSFNNTSNDFGIGQYNSDGELLSYCVESKTFTTLENTEIVSVILRPSSTAGEVEFKNIQLEEGTEATSYEPYVEPKVTNIYLDEPLRKVGDTVDYIDFNNKQVVRNVGAGIVPTNTAYFLTGSSWQIDGYSSVYLKHFFEPTSNTAKSLGNVLCNRFKSGKWEWSGLNEPYNAIGYQGNYVYVIISNELTGITDEDDDSTKITKIKNWLETNKTEIYFPLANQQIESIDLPDIEVLEGYNNITVNTSVQPSNVKLTMNK